MGLVQGLDAREYVPRLIATKDFWDTGGGGTIITDGTTNSLDLSSKIPVGTRAIVLSIYGAVLAGGGEVNIWTDVTNYPETVGIISSPSIYGGNNIAGVMIIPVDSTRTIDYACLSSSGFDNLNFNIIGWFL